MKKKNFICPCCGLPNHLELTSRGAYDSYLEDSTEGDFEPDAENHIFDWYVLKEGETEAERREEIQKRFNLIKKYCNTYNNFSDWFNSEVVAFINEKDPEPEEYIKYMLLTYNIQKKGLVIDKDIIEEYIKVILDNYKIDEYIKVNLDNYQINEHIYIPIDIDNIEENDHYNLSMENTAQPSEHKFIYNSQTIIFLSTDGSNAEIIRGDN